MREMFGGFAMALGAGVLLVYLVLVLLFGGFLQPLTIMSALPLSLGGALAALLLAQKSLGVAAVVGVMMLMGIVAKNSILLVEFAIEEMRAGKDRLTALLEAGHKRARPIVMTSVAMIAGMLPVAVGMAGGASFQAQMAIAVIGGLVTSTGLTLVMVPAAFTWIDDLERWLGRKMGNRLVNKDQTTAAPMTPAVPHAPGS
jgi:HAE1 family hydrophobic/amphiphilic exporter-1